jgi:hypothetical protein
MELAEVQKHFAQFKRLQYVQFIRVLSVSVDFALKINFHVRALMVVHSLNHTSVAMDFVWIQQPSAETTTTLLMQDVQLIKHMLNAHKPDNVFLRVLDFRHVLNLMDAHWQSHSDVESIANHQLMNAQHQYVIHQKSLVNLEAVKTL